MSEVDVQGDVRFHGGNVRSRCRLRVLPTEIVAVDLVYYTYDGQARRG